MERVTQEPVGDAPQDLSAGSDNVAQSSDWNNICPATLEFMVETSSLMDDTGTKEPAAEVPEDLSAGFGNMAVSSGAWSSISSGTYNFVMESTRDGDGVSTKEPVETDPADLSAGSAIVAQSPDKWETVSSGTEEFMLEASMAGVASQEPSGTTTKDQVVGLDNVAQSPSMLDEIISSLSQATTSFLLEGMTKDDTLGDQSRTRRSMEYGEDQEEASTPQPEGAGFQEVGRVMDNKEDDLRSLEDDKEDDLEDGWSGRQFLMKDGGRGVPEKGLRDVTPCQEVILKESGTCSPDRRTAGMDTKDGHPYQTGPGAGRFSPPTRGQPSCGSSQANRFTVG